MGGNGGECGPVKEPDITAAPAPAARVQDAAVRQEPHEVTYEAAPGARGMDHRVIRNGKDVEHVRAIAGRHPELRTVWLHGKTSNAGGERDAGNHSVRRRVDH